MGSNCCRQKDQSPKVSIGKVISRWTHSISPKTATVIIEDVDDWYNSKPQNKEIVVSDPVFESPENEDRNHVTMLLPDAPRNPSKKKTRLINKRVSFQSDVEIMRTASSKSLDRFTVTTVQEEPKARSKSFDSYFDATGLSPSAEYLKKRRTSSLEHMAVEDSQSPATLVAKLRRDTLGDALDFNAYKRPLVLPKPEEPLIEEEPENRSSDDEEEDDEAAIMSFKLASKLRRDTLGDALLLTKSRHKDDTPTGSSTEDLEETVKHSRLCSKLRRDTFGDALRQAVHCKACSSMEDITELEVPLPATPEEDDNILSDQTTETKEVVEPQVVTSKPEETTSSTKFVRSESKCAQCKSCRSLELETEDSDQCVVCSSNENIPDTQEPLKRPETAEKSPKRHSLDNATPRKLTLTDEEISQTLEKIRTTGKVEPREPYNLVYSSSMKGPFASSKESVSKDSKSSSQDSLDVEILNKTDLFNVPDKNRNHILT